MTGVITTTVSHRSFSGLRVAVTRGSDLSHLRGDQFGSTPLSTLGSNDEASRSCYASASETRRLW